MNKDLLISEMWQARNKDIDEININDPDYLHKTAITRIAGTGNFEQVAQDIDRRFGLDGMNILEVGGGYGELCSRIKTITPVKYTLLDTPSMMRISQKFLDGKGVTFVSCEAAEMIFKNNYDLFIAINCLSEMTEEYRNWILDNILPNCSNYFIVDGDINNLGFNNELEKKIQQYFPYGNREEGYGLHGTTYQTLFMGKRI